MLPPRDPRDEAGAWAYFNALRKRREARWIDAADPTVRDLAKLYLAWCEQRVKQGAMARGHFQTLQTRLGKFAAFEHEGVTLESRRAGLVTVEEMTAWVEHLQRVGHKPHYVRNCVRGVLAMFAWAARSVHGREPRTLLTENPLAGFKVPGAGRMPERFAPRSEAAAFLKYWRSRISRGRRPATLERRTLLLERVLIRTGCRPGETCNMRWDDIRWDGGVSSAGHRYAKVVLPEHKTGKKTEKPRVVFLTPILTRALRRLARRPDRHPEFVFTHPRGTRVRDAGIPSECGDPWNSVALSKKVRDIRREAIAAGVPLQDHGANRLVNYRWRHTAASTLLMMGIDVTTVAELLGTSPEMIRLHYGHLLDEHLAAAAEKLQGVLPTRSNRPKS